MDSIFAHYGARSVQEESLDHLLIINELHLEYVLREYNQYYNQARPHQGLRQHIPESTHQEPGHGAVRRRNVLGGLIHDYYREAA